MKVSFYEFSKLHSPKFQDSVLERFSNILKKNAFVEGEFNSSFEQGFAKKQEAKFCALVGNGTDAIEIALQAYGVKAGDKVGVAAISFYATAEAVINMGATPVFIDIDPMTGLLCPKSLERVIESHELKVVIPVHIYGLTSPMEEIERICTPRGIKIIEDAAQAQGGSYANSKAVGSRDNLITFSFYPTKNLGAMGDAGAILCQDETLFNEITCIRNHGRSPNGHRLVGRNSRCDHFQAAVLDLKLETIDTHNKSRKEAALNYLELLKDLPIDLCPEELAKTSSWHLFRIGLKDEKLRDELKEFLIENEIGCAAHFYTKAMAEEEPIKHFPGEREQAIAFAKTSLCLPMHPFLTKEDVEFVSMKLHEFFKV